ncbi:MAG: IS21 family transposase [Acidiferrobacteraceae bacterium]
MLKKRDFMMIQDLIQQGVSQKDVAERLGVHPKTVRRALRRGRVPKGVWPRRGQALDAYKPQIDALVRDGVWNAVVILREIQAQGYTGCYTSVKKYLRPKRVLRPGRATVRFETEPGRQAQLDWGELWTVIGGLETKVYFSAVTLGYARRFHAWAFDRLDAEHMYESVVRAFVHFGGSTREILIDNPKALVLTHRVGDTVVFNARFLDLCAHYGTTPRACKPYRARTKGKDERMVGYLKHHFFVRYRQFESWAHLNQQLEAWLKTEADARVHGTVQEVVAERFTREAPHLQPLPKVPFDTRYHERRMVSWDGYVEVRGNRYSVPDACCGQEVTIRLTLDGQCSVFDAQDRQVAEHALRAAGSEWVTVPGHHQRLWDETLKVECRNLAAYAEVA